MFKERRELLQTFHSNVGGVKDAFMQIQRVLWEKVLFPKRYAQSKILCVNCGSYGYGRSFCLQCGNCFCLEHFREHGCRDTFGVDVISQQLFYFKPDIGRIFLFDASIDRIIMSAKLAELDSLPLDSPLDPKGPVLPVPWPPLPLPFCGTASWLCSVLQCLVANPIIAKWFLSGVNITEGKDREEPVHNHLVRLFLAQVRDVQFCLPECLLAVWNLIPTLAEESVQPHEFLMILRQRLDAFYEKKLGIRPLHAIFGWQFFIADTCENCEVTSATLEETEDLSVSTSGSSTIRAALERHLLRPVTGPKCPSCRKSTRRQTFFETVPQTLTVAFVKEAERERMKISMDEDLILNDFFPADKRTQGEVRFKLSGLVVRTNGDQYCALVRRWGLWFKCGDGVTEPIEPIDGLKDVCLLFYTRSGVISQ